MKHVQGNVVACDVDGTLIAGGRVNAATVALLRRLHSEGREVMIWSARGSDYARKAAEKAGVDGIASAIIGKPAFIIDDKGWTWTRFVARLIPRRA